MLFREGEKSSDEREERVSANIVPLTSRIFKHHLAPPEKMAGLKPTRIKLLLVIGWPVVFLAVTLANVSFSKEAQVDASQDQGRRLQLRLKSCIGSRYK